MKESLKGVGNTTTYANDLRNYAKKEFGRKFRGVFAADKIPKLRNGEMAIINLDTSDMPGSHWVCAVKSNGKVLVYDSFGRETDKILRSIHKNNKNVQDTENDAEQHKKETNCGLRCIAFLKVFHNHGIEWAKHI